MRRGDAQGMSTKEAEPPAVMENGADKLSLVKCGELPRVTAVFVIACFWTEWAFTGLMGAKEEPAIDKFIAALLEHKVLPGNLVDEWVESEFSDPRILSVTTWDSW